MSKLRVDFDVIIVGSGPSGMFTALELSKLRPDLKIAIFEKGSFREERTENNLISGWGGAGAFSDGKLTLPNSRYPNSLNIGGQLSSFIGQEKFLELADYVNQIYTRFGGRANIYEEGKEQKIQQLVDKASTFGLRITPTRIRHFGSDLAPKITKNIKEELERKGVEIFLETPVKSIRKEDQRFLLKVGGKNPKAFKTQYVVAAPGREGAEWLVNQAKALGIEIEPRQSSVDIGVRVEVQDHILKPLTDLLYDPKIEFYPKPYEDKVRSFCMCPNGEVILEKYRGLLITVNGHSLYEKSLSENTNFALLVSVNFTEPFKEPIRYAGRISELANMLGGKVLVQRLGDLRAGRRSKPEKIARGLIEPTLKEATPGDLSFALPHRFLTSILGMLEVLDKIVPGVAGEDTLLYGNEVKFYSSRIKTINNFETTIPGFFVAGDGSGYTRGLMQSSMMGVIVARTIANKK